MIVILKSLAVGVGVGFVFGAVKLPIPAPHALAGVMGVFGIYLGYILAKRFLW